MHRFILLAAICVMLGFSSSSGEGDEPVKSQPKAATPSQSFNVQVFAYQSNRQLTPAEFAELPRSLDQLTKDNAVQLVETVRVSVLQDQQAIAQFDRKTAITTGSVTNVNGKQPIKQLHSVGTLVQLTVTPQDEKLSVMLKYESSRFNGEGTDSSPPDILSAKLDTAVLIPVDQMALIGSTDSKPGTILLMKVTK
ncbi:MAG: hypothetical protein U0936_28350 [Planctomycetaceae bacterium]